MASDLDNLDATGRANPAQGQPGPAKPAGEFTDDEWFAGTAAREPGAGMRMAARPKSAMSREVILGIAIVVLVVLGFVLGAFSSPAVVAPSPAAAVDVNALRDAARRHGGLGALDDAALVARLDGLIAARRALAPPAADVVAEADTAGPVEVVEDTVAAAPPTAIETGTTVIAETTKPAPKVEAKPKVEPSKVVETKPEPPKVVETKPEPPKVVETKPEPPKASTSEVDQALAAAKAAADGARWGEARAAYDKVLTLSPGNTRALAGRGRASFELRQIEPAKKDLAAVLASNPTHQSALLLLGSIAQDQGRKAEAKSLYQRYLDAHPNGRQAAQIRALLERL